MLPLAHLLRHRESWFKMDDECDSDLSNIENEEIDDRALYGRICTSQFVEKVIKILRMRMLNSPSFDDHEFHES